ncbi:FkbM family methyltransferase [Flavihumibacter petaseus]|uniref:Putative methyltransferase n=1 Tax=Flavihumibacter petaseus NBRC 106054 TaxID=1220578 RepID=A0A0E9N1Q6_9BACT|nr:FkbM family methyltransferase [Flavihumibacter petaseus]GAO43708.1 putative methyltransferase [Flavihumibacter petaseus NBRC 106054]
MPAIKLLGNLYTDLRQKIAGSFRNKYSPVGIRWSNLKRLRALPAAQENSFRFKGSLVHFRDSNELLHAIDEIYLQELYKSDITVDDPCIFDCGAHIGISVLYFASHFPKARIIAFEPDPANFRLLEKNIPAAVYPGIELRQEAVWKEDTTIQFSTGEGMSSKINTDTTSSRSIKAVRLRDLINQQVDLLKIDIEGAEYEVLKDIQPVLGQVERIFVEYHGSFGQNKELNHLLSILTDSGFQYYIKEANPSYPTPFARGTEKPVYDVQLNIFGFRDTNG